MAQVLDWHDLDMNGNAALHRALAQLQGAVAALEAGHADLLTVQAAETERLNRLHDALYEGLSLVAELASLASLGAFAGRDPTEGDLVAGSGEDAEVAMAEVAMAELNAEELARTADEMRQALDGTDGGVERVLAPYYLALYQRHGRRRLHVGLTERWPELEEVAPALAAFEVPPGTDPEPVTIRLTSQDGRSIPVRTLRFPWTEVDADGGAA